MIEQQLRDGLHAAVTKEPPLGFDPDALVDDARRIAHRRRAAFAAAAAAAIVAAGTVGAVAATRGLNARAPVEPGGLQPAPSSADAVRKLGESLTRALPVVDPDAHDFDVRVTDGQPKGVVLYRNGDRQAALAFVVMDCAPEPLAKACDHDGVHYNLDDADVGKALSASLVRDEVALELFTAETIEALDSAAGPLFSERSPCDCPAGARSLLTQDQLRDLLHFDALQLFDPGDFPPPTRHGRVLTPEEIMQKKLEREADVANREAEAKQEELERELRRKKSAEEPSDGK